MVVTNVLLVVLLIAIIADIWHRNATHARHERAWLDGLSDRFREQEDRIVGAFRPALKLVRADITELWAMQAEGAAELDQCGRLRHEAVLQRLQDYHGEVGQRLDRMEDGALEAAATWRQNLDQQLAELMKEVSDPTILRLMQAIALAFQVETLERLTDGAGVMESAPEGSVGGPLAPHPVPNIGRKLEPARFSEETINSGMQELIEGAAARGITLSLADARKQAMLMLNDVEV